MVRLYVTPDLGSGTPIAPTPDQSRYLTGVMRLTQGDDILIFNGRDGEWRATITEFTKRGVVLTCRELARPQAFGPDLELVVALVKKSRVETIVEKAAELGVRRIRPTITRRTNVEKVRLDRLDAIAMEAAEQTGRLDVPIVDDPEKLEAILDGWDPARRLMFCDEAGGEPAMAALQAAGPGPWAILIGPEGGFAPEERARLRALPFTTAVSLGPRILRADTAAIAAMTLWQAAIGDWER
ncbi:16S rRNA (uracil(1498)-N(3))-methyltransferase [Brevundimonas variabilis]|uniref:Ribosomal RNA small subunit methyltransferase E n=1 Tax=Brevundimonas variabilis TaxID=74312 RepID=A0A7W9FD52_9CAUL|nr:16S rRNA (uracil(1498)-N(3))-methyltransferase [Brevundimonas variabilis]MBB5744897.1 16S rRNA (uracil1498-N3)-methyltransferase [Brevundimonas variabilis]